MPTALQQIFESFQGHCEKEKRRRRKPKFYGAGWKASPGHRAGEGRYEESEAFGEEGEDVKSPKRNLIRVESEETQDNVRSK